MVPPKSPGDSTDVLSTVVEASDWQRALLLLPTCCLSPAVCSRLLSRLSRQSQWRAAQSFFHALPDLGIAFTPGIYSGLLSSYAQKHLWQRSLHLLHSAQTGERSVAPNLDTAVYNSVITSCARASKWQWSICLLAELRHGSRCKANLTSFNAALNACERRGHWVQALDLLQRIQEDHLRPDSLSLNCTLSACEKGQQWQMALALLPLFAAQRCERTMVTYGAITACCVVGSAWEVAMASMAEALENGFSPDEELLNSLTESCRRSWAWQQCLALMTFGRNSKIRSVASQNAMDRAQRPRRYCEPVTIARLLRLSEISVHKFEWNGKNPTIVRSNDWLQQANDLGGSFVRHSLERRNGFAQAGSFRKVLGRDDMESAGGSLSSCFLNLRDDLVCLGSARGLLSVLSILSSTLVPKVAKLSNCTGSRMFQVMRPDVFFFFF